MNVLRINYVQTYRKEGYRPRFCVVSQGWVEPLEFQGGRSLAGTAEHRAGGRSRQGA
jgi:hypothetical protein